jgi:hypothetical protein
MDAPRLVLARNEEEALSLATRLITLQAQLLVSQTTTQHKNSTL